MKSKALEKELDQLYREKCNGMDVLLRLTPLEVEHLNNLIGVGMTARRGSFLKETRKEKRKFIEWEKHLCAMDRTLWEKVREVEKLAFKETEDEVIVL